MQKNRMIIGAVALVAVAMVFAGIGYAVTYTGQTNSTSPADVNYIKVDLPGGDGYTSYTGADQHLYYNTKTTGPSAYQSKLLSGFEIKYKIAITEVPADNDTVNLTAAFPSLTITGAQAPVWSYSTDGTEYTTWSDGAVPKEVSLSSGSATVYVKLTVTPVTEDDGWVSGLPNTSIANINVGFTVSKTVA